MPGPQACMDDGLLPQATPETRRAAKSLRPHNSMPSGKGRPALGLQQPLHRPKLSASKPGPGSLLRPGPQGMGTPVLPALTT